MKSRPDLIAGVALLAFLSLAPAPSSAEAWLWQNPLPQGNTLRNIDCPTSTTCFTVGLEGTLLVSTDGGDTWLILPSGTSENLVDVTCPT